MSNSGSLAHSHNKGSRQEQGMVEYSAPLSRPRPATRLTQGQAGQPAPLTPQESEEIQQDDILRASCWFGFELSITHRPPLSKPLQLSLLGSIHRDTICQALVLRSLDEEVATEYLDDLNSQRQLCFTPTRAPDIPPRYPFLVIQGKGIFGGKANGLGTLPNFSSRLLHGQLPTTTTHEGVEKQLVRSWRKW
ncbi:uncharacterized protein Z519_06253 [Cladophialophora bantiana CBS 173.52]|uniref:Uncharacterized protein n=1 Tax=Cladophialophora bantiana (strain ATCC 10958 / CBS 173.52 / CDC B-1940 / NIH 8579) TaxID=1442370 RepID=A0A0D2HK42_CLAB1|nr:uncharacterized protein Z519_06253 [Cladophialophora bantiana CBS 173.52]KIW93648.1 hypothetical protein Z519_06253 [Cladophialophora bantiana CBS 173.52]